MTDDTKTILKILSDNARTFEALLSLLNWCPTRLDQAIMSAQSAGLVTRIFRRSYGVCWWEINDAGRAAIGQGVAA